MWILYKEPPKPADFVLLGFNTETFIELIIRKQGMKFEVIFQKPFDAHQSDHSRLLYPIESFGSYEDSLEFALDLVGSLKRGDHCYQMQKSLAQNIVPQG